jgi:ABC-2 type transport system ATP-binding protein
MQLSSDRASTSICVQHLRKAFRQRISATGLRAAAAALVFPKYRELVAVKDISFEIPAGEIVAFIGPNGAGKSTTIKMLAGVLWPSSGKISVLGLNPQRQRRQLAMQIGAVYGQRNQLFMNLPPRESFSLIGKIYDVPRFELQQRIAQLIATFDLEAFLDTPARKLSLGQRMRCELAAALISRPKVLFLDEPTIGLDVVARQEVRQIIRTLNRQQGTTIFLTSHESSDIEELAQRTMVINFGSLLFNGSSQSFRESYIGEKSLEVLFSSDVAQFRCSVGQVRERSAWRVCIALPNRLDEIKRCLAEIFEHYPVRDINIFEPSMEEIIAAIYRQECDFRKDRSSVEPLEAAP